MTELVCSMCGQSFEERNGCVYWDEERGIYAATICKTCFAKHILEYYPGGILAGYIRDNLSEYGIEENNETIDKSGEALVHGTALDKEIRQIGLFDALEAVCQTPIEQSKAKVGRE